MTSPAFAQQAAQQQDVRFDIKSFEVEGDSTLGKEAIDKLLAVYTGSNKSLADVQAARDALQKAYEKKGDTATLVVLPKQEVDNGVVHLKATHVAIGKVSVTGNNYFSTQNVLNSLPAVAEGQPLNPAAINANLTLSNENSSRQSTVVLKRGEKEGTMDAGVQVADDKPTKIYATLDNTGTEQTGRHRLSVGYQNANVLDRDNTFVFQYTTSVEKPSSVSVVGANYQIPLYRLGDSVSLYAGVFDVNSGTVAGVLNASGKGQAMGAMYNLHLPKVGRIYDQQIVGGLDYGAYQPSAVLVGSAVNLASDISVSPVSVGYVGHWRELGNIDAGIRVTAVQNVPFGANSDAAAFDLVRKNSNNRFSLFRYNASISKALPMDWSVHALVDGQYTNEMLTSPEQYGLGGADGVRGFDEREVLDDMGYRGTLEIYTPDFGAKMGNGNTHTRALVFYDFGAVRRIDPLAGERRSDSIASAGVGLRIGYGKNATLKLDFAQVTRNSIDPVAAGVNLNEKQVGDKMVHAALMWVW